MDENFTIRRASIGIDDGKIRKIGKIPMKAEEVIDATGKIVMPGLIVPYCLPQEIFPCFLQNRKALSREGVLVSADVSTAKLVESGATFVVSLFVTREASKVLVEIKERIERIGIRGKIGFSAGAGGEHSRKIVGEIEKFARSHRSRRIDCLVETHISASDDFLEYVHDIASEHKIKHYINMKFSQEEDMQLDRLSRLGILAEDTVLIDLPNLDEDGLHTVEKHGGGIIHHPLCLNPHLYMETIRRGIPTAMSASKILDVFELMRHVYFRLLSAGIKLKAETLLQTFTRKAAEICGVNAGSIQAEKDADLIILNLPPTDPPSLPEYLLLQASGAYVETVICQGEPIKQEGRLLKIDKAETQSQLMKFLKQRGNSHG